MPHETIPFFRSGVLGRVAAGVVQQGASEVVRGSGSTAGRIVGNAARGAATQAASNYASTVRNKDEITLGFKLETADGKVLIEGRDKRASKADGEDLLSPLVERAAERILQRQQSTRDPNERPRGAHGPGVASAACPI